MSAPAGPAPAGAQPPAVALVGATIISFSAILYRLSEANPLTGAFFRMVYALPVLAALSWIVRRQDHRSARARWLAFVSGAMLGIDVIAWQVAIDHIGAGLATLVANSQVVLVPLATWVLLAERPSRRVFMAMPVVLVGLAAVTGLGSEASFGSRPVLGVMAGVAAACFYTAFLVGFRRSNKALTHPAGPLLDATAGAAVAVGLPGLVTGSLDLAPTWPSHGWLLLLAVGAQALGWLAISFALPRLPAAVTSFVILLQPTLTLFWGWLIFAEQAGPIQLMGVVLVIAGIATVAIRPRASTSPQSPRPGPSRPSTPDPPRRATPPLRERR